MYLAIKCQTQHDNIFNYYYYFEETEKNNYQKSWFYMTLTMFLFIWFLIYFSFFGLCEIHYILYKCIYHIHKICIEKQDKMNEMCMFYFFQIFQSKLQNTWKKTRVLDITMPQRKHFIIFFLEKKKNLNSRRYSISFL